MDPSNIPKRTSQNCSKAYFFQNWNEVDIFSLVRIFFFITLTFSLLELSLQDRFQNSFNLNQLPFYIDKMRKCWRNMAFSPQSLFKTKSNQFLTTRKQHILPQLLGKQVYSAIGWMQAKSCFLTQSVTLFSPSLMSFLKNEKEHSSTFKLLRISMKDS